MKYWKVPPDWEGQECFIVGGGPSVLTQDVERLQGRKVIAVNSSYLICPWADYLFTTDARWLRHHEKPLREFAGRIVASNDQVKWPRLYHLKKLKPPPGLTDNRQAVMVRRTSLHGAINMAVHLGVSRIVLLGADGQRGSGGKCHHHEPHPWPVKPGCWDEQKVDLRHAAAALRERGVECVNASPGSAWGDLWPVMTLSEALCSPSASSLAALPITKTSKASPSSNGQSESTPVLMSK